MPMVFDERGWSPLTRPEHKPFPMALPMNSIGPFSHRCLVVECLLLAVATLGVTRPAFGHAGDVVLAPETSLTATFSLSPSGGSLASAAINGFSSGNIEVNYPGGFVSFWMGTGARMEDIAFNDPGLGSFELKAWRIGIESPSGLSGEPLGSDGHFDPADHVVAIDQGVLTGNLTGLGLISRDFSVSPLVLSPKGPLSGFIFGNTGGGSAVVSFQIPWDHQGSLWSSGEASLEVAVRGLVSGGGEFSPVPEPSSFLSVALALSVMGFCRLRAKGTGGGRLSKIPEASGITAP